MIMEIACIEIDPAVCTLGKQRDGRMNVFAIAVNAVKRQLTATIEVDRFSVLTSTAVVRYVLTARTETTEILARIATKNGIVETCSRYPWAMNKGEAAVYFRASMQRHNAVAA